MGMKHRDYLSSERVYGCHVCKTHLSVLECVESKNFTGQHGRAWLFTHVVNVVEGEEGRRQMTTGLHKVRDLACSKCGSYLGWKYVEAFDEEQKYKEGKYILEQAMFVKVS